MSVSVSGSGESVRDRMGDKEHKSEKSRKETTAAFVGMVHAGALRLACGS